MLAQQQQQLRLLRLGTTSLLIDRPSLQQSRRRMRAPSAGGTAAASQHVSTAPWASHIVNTSPVSPCSSPSSCQFPAKWIAFTVFPRLTRHTNHSPYSTFYNDVFLHLRKLGVHFRQLYLGLFIRCNTRMLSYNVRRGTAVKQNRESLPRLQITQPTSHTTTVLSQVKKITAPRFKNQEQP